MKILSLIFLYFLFPLQSTAANNLGPSFNCQKASTKIELEICSSKLLSFLDLYLSDIYKLSLKKFPENVDNLKKSQRDWLKNHRDNSCLKGDFSWSSYADQYGIDAISTTNLEKCYVLRATEIGQLPCYDPELCNKYKNILSKISKIPELMSSIGSDEENFLIEYGRKFNSLENIDPAERYVLDKYSEYVLEDLFPKCFGVRPSIYYQNGNFFIIQYFGSTVCGGTSIISNQKANLCIKNNSVVNIDSYWECINKVDTDSILEMLTIIIKNEKFSETIENIRSYDSQSSFISTSESYLLSVLTYFPFLTYNHPSLYSTKTMDWIDNNHQLFLSILGNYKKDVLTILNYAKYMHKAIIQEENWQQKLTHIVETQERHSLGFNVDDERIMNSRIVGTIYNLRDFYILAWARVYKYGKFQNTINTIDKLIVAIETINENSH